MWRRDAQPGADAVDERTIADRHEDRAERQQVSAIHGVAEFGGHRACACRDPGIVAVHEKLDVVLGGVGIGAGTGVIEVLPHLENRGAECPHPGDLRPIGVARGEHHGRDAQRPSGVGDALAEVAGRGDYDRTIGAQPPLPCQGLHNHPGPTALERPDRVGGLDLDDDRHAGTRGEALVQVLRGVDKDGRDALAGQQDRVWGQRRVVDHEPPMPEGDRPAHTKTPEGTADP